MPRDYMPRFALGPAQYAGALDARQTFAVASPMLSGSMWPHQARGCSETELRTPFCLPQYTPAVWHGLPDVALSRQSQCHCGRLGNNRGVQLVKDYATPAFYCGRSRTLGERGARAHRCASESGQ